MANGVIHLTRDELDLLSTLVYGICSDNELEADGEVLDRIYKKLCQASFSKKKESV